MKGSSKQIKWANTIKQNIDNQIAPLMGKAPHFDKMLSFISSIDNASFWIDNKDENIKSLLNNLISHGLRVKGLEFSDLAKSDKQGNITFSNV